MLVYINWIYCLAITLQFFALYNSLFTGFVCIPLFYIRWQFNDYILLLLTFYMHQIIYKLLNEIKYSNGDWKPFASFSLNSCFNGMANAKQMTQSHRSLCSGSIILPFFSPPRFCKKVRIHFCGRLEKNWELAHTQNAHQFRNRRHKQGIQKEPTESGFIAIMWNEKGNWKLKAEVFIHF